MTTTSSMTTAVMRFERIQTLKDSMFSLAGDMRLSGKKREALRNARYFFGLSLPRQAEAEISELDKRFLGSSRVQKFINEGWQLAYLLSLQDHEDLKEG